jgi:acyl carrier protein
MKRKNSLAQEYGSEGRFFQPKSCILQAVSRAACLAKENTFRNALTLTWRIRRSLSRWSNFLGENCSAAAGQGGRSMTHAGKDRSELAHMLRASGVFGLRDQGLEDDFIAGRTNPLLADLGIDSLAEMELCIAIENEFGVSIVPADLGDLKTLEGVLQRIEGGRDNTT